MNLDLRRATWYLSCILVLFVGCSDDSPEALLRSAKQYIAKKQANEAVIQLKTLLQQTPDSAEARFLLGSVFLDTGDALSADTELRKALDLQHPKEAVVPALAKAMVLEGQYQRLAAEFAGTELADAVAAADLNTSLAIGYARQGKGKEADAALESALRTVPQYSRARVTQARFKAEARDIDGAFALIDDVLRQDPDNYEAWQLKGDLLYAVKRDAAAALDAHRQSLKIRGDLASSHASILSILFAQKDIGGARRQLAELKKIAPNQVHTRYFEAELAFLDRDFKTAKEISQQLLRVVPDDFKVLQLAGAIEYQAGSWVQAEALLAKALRIAPNMVTTRRLLVQSHLRSGQSDKAMELLAPLLEAPQPDAETLSLAAQAYLISGDAKNAEVYFARVAKLNPDDVRSRTALALAQFSKGSPELGFSQLEEIAAADKGTVADLALITTYLRQGSFDAGLKAIDRLERKQPNTAMTASLRGLIQMTRKDLKSARQGFERALAIDPGYFPALVNLAAMDLAEKKPEQARKRFEAVLAIDPKNVNALLAVASLRSSAGASKEEVKELLSNAVRLNPTAVEPRLRLIDAQVKSGDLKSALSTAQDGAAAQPNSPELRETLGRVQLASGDTSQAIASFNKLAEMRPRSPQPALLLAEVYVAARNTDAARQSFKRALAIAPDLMAAQRGLITLEVSAGRPKEALALARAVQGIPSRAAVGFLYAGEIEASQKNWAAAVAAYRASLKLEDSSETAIKLHSALVKSNQKGEADRLVAEWTKRHPQTPALLAYAGNEALWRQDYAAAEGIYTSIIRMQPDNAIAFNNLAVITNKLHKPGAIAYAEKANALQPRQPAIMDTLATILAESDQIGKAVELEKQAVELQPGNHPLRLNLAKLYIKAGQKSLAKSELEQLAKIGDRFSRQDEVGRLLKGL